MTRAAAYLRVSSRDQVEGYSLDAQRRAILAYCAAHDWGEPEWWEDAGVSAYTDDRAKRPAFAGLLARVEERGYDVVIVHSLDRWARSMLAALREFKVLQNYGVALVSITEAYDFTTDHGEMLFSFLCTFAQHYSKALSRHVKKGLHEKRRQGGHVGFIPWGALRVGSKLVIDPDKAESLRLVYRLAGEKSQQATADELNALGIPAPRGGRWYSSQISNMRGKQGAWLRDMGTEWAALYDRASRKAHVPPVNHTDRIYMLTGLLRCSCGGWINYHLVQNRKRDGVERRYGRCRNNANPARRGCTTWGTNLGALEEVATAWLFALPDPRADVPVPVDTALHEAFEAKRRRVIGLREEGLYTDEEWGRAKAGLFAEESRLPVTSGRRVEIGKQLATARKYWALWNDEERNAFLRGLVLHFIVDHGAIRPVFRPVYAAVWPQESDDGSA